MVRKTKTRTVKKASPKKSTKKAVKKVTTRKPKSVTRIHKDNKSESPLNTQDIIDMCDDVDDLDEYDVDIFEDDEDEQEEFETEKEERRTVEKRKRDQREEHEIQPVQKVDSRVSKQLYLNKEIEQSNVPTPSSEGTAQALSTQRLPNHIKEYFVKVENSKEAINSKELFSADRDNIDIKTELSDEEIQIINRLMINDAILVQHGLQPVFSIFTNQFMRLKISRNRQSRQEFVDINRQSNTHEMLSGLQGLSNMTSIKKAQR